MSRRSCSGEARSDPTRRVPLDHTDCHTDGASHAKVRRYTHARQYHVHYTVSARLFLSVCDAANQKPATTSAEPISVATSTLLYEPVAAHSSAIPSGETARAIVAGIASTLLIAP